LVLGILRSASSADTFVYEISGEDGGKSETDSSGNKDD
jgi:hypothetical protein